MFTDLLIDLFIYMQLGPGPLDLRHGELQRRGLPGRQT